MSIRKHQKKIYQKKRGKIKLLLKIFFFLLLSGIAGFLALFIYYAKDLPRPEVFTERELPQSTKIYDKTGEILLYEIYGEERRTYVPLRNVPEHLKQAVLATEDANFYHHIGVDPKGIARAILADFKIGKPAYGASTIPQQLIRSTFLTLEKTTARKTREIILAIEMDRRYSKDQILEWYLNQIPFGQNAYGVEAASEVYFGKPVSQVSLSEAAILAALIKGPYFYSPYGENKDGLLARKDYILDRMAKEGYLKKEDAEKVKKEGINFIEKKQEIKAPYFTLWVKQQLEEKYGQDFLSENGLKVYTSLDWDLQKLAEETVREGVKRNKAYNAHNAGMVAISPKTGEVLAMTVGTGDYYATSSPADCISGKNCLFDPKFNVVVGTKETPGRQPGSAFKPFIYATAFKNGFDDKYIIGDNPTDFGLWGGKEYTPQNYDGKFRGPISLRSALAQSLNIPSIKVLYLAGVNDPADAVDTDNFVGKENILLEGLKNSIETAKDMGITTLNKPMSSYGPAIVLGGGEVKLLDITSAYGVFAAEGLKIPPVSILKIEDQNGNIIEENKKTPQRVLGTEVARLINSMLSDNEARTPMFGPRSHLYFENYQVAVKTGTTNDYKDAWIIGYTGSIAMGVWVGNNNNEPLVKKQPAATVAGPIFHDFMEKALAKYPKENFRKPEEKTNENQTSSAPLN